MSDGTSSGSHSPVAEEEDDEPAHEDHQGSDKIPSIPWPRLEDDNDDSALGDDLQMSTASASSSIFHYRILNGRTYYSERFGEDRYWSPNDERQSEAMDMIHSFLRLCLDGKLHLAPIEDNVQKILDIGTGTGIWAVDMAKNYAGCTFIVTDLSPIQPEYMPPNVIIEIDDAELLWTWHPSSFDFVHIRYLIGAISDWPKLFRQAYAALKPGGWIESYEPEAEYHSDDGTLEPDSAMVRWQRLFKEAGKKTGRPFTMISDNITSDGIRDAGFVDIHTVDYKIPIGSWPEDPKLKEIGKRAEETFLADLEGYAQFAWNTVLGMPMTEMHIFLMEYRQEIRNPAIHTWLPQRLIYARKPVMA
ncbi:Uu.00g097480.m01.CDS01 [Anthostomella pinea]|uniref:Uu.00g097480.m01.CDS01 n=1 Tax=Anthostomella pinea TaxID=933095 RepID=A0AAI8VCF0_9PEZI|nr:Uu.00g097480.m01.CDS01 [Anthostomella pinea]